MKYPLARKLPALLLAFPLCCVSVSSALAADVPNKKEIIAKARQSYYNLRTQGMAGYSCNITPDWNLLLAAQWKSDPTAADKAVKTLKQIQFNMVLATDNSVKISHSVPLAGSDQDSAALNQIYSGMKQMTEGFFQTATPFILDSPFPAADSDFQLEDQGSQYLLSYKEGNS
ncbi:MAG TPA: hypothetical protein VLV89_08675, partial [Candidatus Acidoferrum sp.]|nr:hypothetical protein [Candidatus Acidoferrum sp.]